MGSSPWTPRLPLTLAEAQVDYPAHRDHIDTRRREVERALRASAVRMAHAATDLNGVPARRPIRVFQAGVVRQLDATARFGYRQAQTEVLKLRGYATGARKGTARPEAPVLAGWVFPDAGQYAANAKTGLEGLKHAIAHRANQAASVIVTAVAATLVQDPDATRTDKILAVTAVANRILHNAVLELVGETLNLGRTAGVMDIPDNLGGPPEYAMRSEVMDDNTCDGCEAVQGEIVQVDSSDYDQLMPPNGCDGGGRCRGIMVYGDSYSDVSLEEAA